MKLRNLLYILVALLVTASCYDDKGNYDYREINELEILGIADSYSRDMDEILVIKPQIEGTFYSDTSRFTYAWIMSNEVVSEAFELEYLIDSRPGTKTCRFIVTDKETGVKAFKQFNLSVSSATAGDLIMVLSKYDGRAELSYLRLLTEEDISLGKTAEWAVNYFQGRFEEPLGTNPRQLAIIYTEGQLTSSGYPFITEAGRIMVLADNKIRLIDKASLEPDTFTPYLIEEAYTGVISYPPPEIEGYEPQFINEGFDFWRQNAYGSGFQILSTVTQISGGKLWFASSLSSTTTWSPSFSTNVNSPYGGYISPFCFWDDMDPAPGATYMSYVRGDEIYFDQTNGRFFTGYGYYVVSQVPLTVEVDGQDVRNFDAFPNYRLKWGSATNLAEKTALAVLSDGSACRLVTFKTADVNGDGSEEKTMTGNVAGGLITDASKMYVMKYTNYMFFTDKNKIYTYNLLDVLSGNPPSGSNMVVQLSDYGYGPDAVITDICVSRSERTMLVGVSRYGADDEAMGEEPKGDILWFDLDASNLTLTHNAEKSAEGISGIPVDVEIKHRTHYRDGLYQGVMMDTI